MMYAKKMSKSAARAEGQMRADARRRAAMVAQADTIVRSGMGKYLTLGLDAKGVFATMWTDDRSAATRMTEERARDFCAAYTGAYAVNADATV